MNKGIDSSQGGYREINDEINELREVFNTLMSSDYIFINELFIKI